jgi:hypothetical protein
MSRQRSNIFAADVAVTTAAEQRTLDRGPVGPRWAVDEYRRVYDAPLPDDAPRLRRCAYPRCADEAAVRCATCWRRYCGGHCPATAAGAGETRDQCVFCARHLGPDRPTAPSHHGALSAGCAIAGFLGIIAVGLAIDVSAKAQGLVAFVVFAVAFWAFLRYMDG